MCFGSSGMFEQDDVENWVSITEMAAGSMARRLMLNSRMGLTSEDKPVKPPMAGFAGPGVAYQGFGEFNQRHWLRRSGATTSDRGRPVTADRRSPTATRRTGRAPVPGRGGRAARRRATTPAGSACSARTSGT